MQGTTLTPAACQMPRCTTARTMMTTTTLMTRCVRSCFEVCCSDAHCPNASETEVIPHA
jgi:hypothetical protein